MIWKFLVPLADERMYPLQPDKVVNQSKEWKNSSATFPNSTILTIKIITFFWETCNRNGNGI
jgi:hypothetical protein